MNQKQLKCNCPLKLPTFYICLQDACQIKQRLCKNCIKNHTNHNLFVFNKDEHSLQSLLEKIQDLKEQNKNLMIEQRKLEEQNGRIINLLLQTKKGTTNENIVEENKKFEQIFQILKIIKPKVGSDLDLLYRIFIFQTEILNLRKKTMEAKTEIKDSFCKLFPGRPVLVSNDSHLSKINGKSIIDKNQLKVYELWKSWAKFSLQPEKIREISFMTVYDSKSKTDLKEKINFLFEELKPRFSNYQLSLFVSQEDDLPYTIGNCKGCFLYPKNEFLVNILIILS